MCAGDCGCFKSKEDKENLASFKFPRMTDKVLFEGLLTMELSFCESSGILETAALSFLGFAKHQLITC